MIMPNYWTAKHVTQNPKFLPGKKSFERSKYFDACSATFKPIIMLEAPDGGKAKASPSSSKENPQSNAPPNETDVQKSKTRKGSTQQT